MYGIHLSNDVTYHLNIGVGILSVGITSGVNFGLNTDIGLRIILINGQNSDHSFGII